MPARIKRKQSKRMTCRRKYKIIKKVAEHQRKIRRERKKNPGLKKTKEPGIPKSLPFYQDILEEVERRKVRAQDLKMKKKTLQTQNREINGSQLAVCN